MTTRSLSAVARTAKLDAPPPVALSKLPRAVRKRCQAHKLLYDARNLEDGPPVPVTEWSAHGALRHVLETYLALGLAAGFQRSEESVSSLTARLTLERHRSAELALQASAGVELARAINAVEITQASALLLARDEYAAADTEPIPRQRVSS